MINIEFKLADGTTKMIYDVHPASQEQAGLPVPDAAVSYVIWIGTR